MEKQTQNIQSVVVLPFDNYSGDEDQAYLLFGIHDALISELGQLESLRVISKTSTLSYLNSSKTIGEIASDFNVDAVIEGSILSSEDILRLQLKIIRAFPEEKQIWARSFEVKLSDVLKLYSEVIRNIADEVRLKLSPEKLVQLDQTREVNPDAYKAFLRGKYCLFQLTPEGVKKGLEYLHQAVLIDPADPFAYAALAQGYLDTTHGPINPVNAYEKAESAINQAMKLDKNLPEILTVQAEICMYITWKFDQAEAYYKRSLELNPNLSWTHYHYAWALYLFGRDEEAVWEHEQAQKCDPFHPYITALTGALYSYVKQYEAALREAFKSLDMIKDFPFGYFVLGETYLALNENEKAIRAHEKLAALSPEWNWRLGETYALTGHREKAEKILKEVENGPIVSWTAMGLAALYGALGKYDLAFKWLTYEPHHAWIPWVAVMPMWESLYKDPRYETFIRKFKFPEP
jgi:TolB-like protein/Flp pilus assembly protein TadD